MFPGYTTKLSEEYIALATTIYPKKDMAIVNDTTSTTVVATIAPTFGGGFGGFMVMVNRSGANLTTVTTGNILTAVTVPVNTSVVFTYSKLLGKFIPGALA